MITGIEKCHAEHMKVAPNKVQVTVTLDVEDVYAFYGLAKKYNDGCLAQFIKETSRQWIWDNLKEEVASAERLLNFRKGETVL